MKMAQGYVTDDGTFFESKIEAALYEAELVLRAALTSYNGGIDHEKFLAVILALMPELGRFIDAHNAADTAKLDQQVEDRAATNNSPSPEATGGAGHVSSTEEDLASLLQLPTRGPSGVSNVGSSPRTEKVQERRPEHGPRVRGADASGVRRRKDMAVKQDTKS